MLQLIYLFLSTILAASNSCSTGATTVLFTNGIDCSESDANVNVGLLKNALANTPLDDDPNATEYKLAYNESPSKRDDILESAKQVAKEKFERFVKGIFGDANSLDEESEAFLLNADKFTDQLEQSNATYIVTEVSSAIKKGNRVLHVGHSQGSLFVNRVYQQLSSEQRTYYRGEHVASMAGILYPGMDYTSFKEDLPVYALSLMRTVLPGNISTSDPTAPTDDISTSIKMKNHFWRAYMHHTSARNKIVSQMKSLISSVEYPVANIGKGPITATMTWSGATDVDLHTFEPNGQHVYYGMTSGTNGHLDLDNTYGYGPEHYYVTKCDDLSVGSFRFGANYYRGSGAQSVTIKIETPTDQASKTTVLSAARGSSGNSSPVMMMNVNVTKDKNGKYTFSIK